MQPPLRKTRTLGPPWVDFSGAALGRRRLVAILDSQPPLQTLAHSGLVVCSGLVSRGVEGVSDRLCYYAIIS